MAHKIKVRAVPHINRDGSAGTKKDYVVRCKSRGKVCTHEKFSTRREAEEFKNVGHWEAVKDYRSRPNIFRRVKRSIDSSPSPILRLRVQPNVPPATVKTNRAPRQAKTGVRAA